MNETTLWAIEGQRERQPQIRDQSEDRRPPVVVVQYRDGIPEGVPPWEVVWTKNRVVHSRHQHAEAATSAAKRIEELYA